MTELAAARVQSARRIAQVVCHSAIASAVGRESVSWFHARGGDLCATPIVGDRQGVSRDQAAHGGKRSVLALRAVCGVDWVAKGGYVALRCRCPEVGVRLRELRIAMRVRRDVSCRVRWLSSGVLRIATGICSALGLPPAGS